MNAQLPLQAALEEAYGSFHIHFFEADGSFLGGIDQRGLEKCKLLCKDQIPVNWFR